MTATPDAQREIDIQAAINACHEAKARGDREEADRQWHRFLSLIAQRSPKRVRQMEKGRGLL